MTRSHLIPEPRESAWDRLRAARGAALSAMASASGYWTYEGAVVLLEPAGSDVLTKAGAAVIAVAVTAGIWLFWLHVFDLIGEEMGNRKKKLVPLILLILLGCTGILVTSSNLNATALVGPAGREQQLAATAPEYERALGQSERRARRIAQLAPDIEKLALRYEEMARAERETGALTGSRGDGPVTALLDQIAGDLRSLSQAGAASGEQIDALVAKAVEHLSAMRGLVNGAGRLRERINAFADEADAIDTVIARLNEESVAPAIRRAAENFGKGLVMGAGSANAAFKQVQKTVIANIQEALTADGAALKAAAEEIESLPPIESPGFRPLPASIATVVYWKSFIAPWALAIGIDMLPLLLVGFGLISADSRKEHEQWQRDNDALDRILREELHNDGKEAL